MHVSMHKDRTLATPLAGGLAEYKKYSGWPELKESLMAGKVQAAYMLAPMVMDLADKGVPVKIVGVGHRSGAVIMVKTEAPYQTFADLKGKRVAIPSRFAVDHIFVRKIMQQYGMSTQDLELVEMAPPDMPAALYAGAIEAYATGEPFGAVSQKAGYGRPLYMTRDHWPNYLCCVLTVRDELVRTDRPMVQKLVDHIMSAGVWLDAMPAHRTSGVEVAAGPQFFNQDREILNFVMRNPPDRVTYGDLRIIRQEFEELVQLSIEAGILSRPVAYEKFVDESFVRDFKPVEIVLKQP